MSYDFSKTEFILSSLSWHLFDFTLDDFLFLKEIKDAGVSWNNLVYQLPASHPCSRHKKKLMSIGEFWFDIEIQDQNLKKKYVSVNWYPFYDSRLVPVFSNYIDKPFLLHAIGDDISHSGLRLGVVGSREPRHGLEQFLEGWLNAQFKKMPVTLISGGARGVDQIAHKAAILNQCKTWVWVPSGLLNLYPQSLEKWVGLASMKQVTMVSPFSPNAEMRKHLFIARNAFIAASSHALLVASAAHKSGTILTAKHCIEFNIPLYSIPSDPWNISSQGCLSLIRDGAEPILSVNDSPNWESIARNLPEFICS